MTLRAEFEVVFQNTVTFFFLITLLHAEDECKHQEKSPMLM